MRVWIDRDEIYPVYSLHEDIPDWYFIQEYVIEMGEKDFARLQQSLQIAEKNYWAVQDEIGELFRKHHEKLKCKKEFSPEK